MKFMILILSFFSLSISVQAADQTGKKEKSHQHREHGAHVHGAGNMALAFDAEKGKLQFKAAAEAILGFEHQPRSEKDKKAVAEAVHLFETSIQQMVQLDPALHCQFTKELIGQVPEAGEEGSGEHSDWAANFTVLCAKSPVGTTMKVDFSSLKKLHDVDITILADAVQKSAEFKQKPVSIELK